MRVGQAKISAHRVIAQTYRYVFQNALSLARSLWPFALAMALAGQLLNRTVSHWAFQIAGYGFAILVTTLCSTKAAAIIARHVLRQQETAWSHALQLDDEEWWLFRKYLLFLLVLLCAALAVAIPMFAVFISLYALSGDAERILYVAQFGPLTILLAFAYCFVNWSFFLPPVALIEKGGLRESVARAKGRLWSLVYICATTWVPALAFSSLVPLLPIRVEVFWVFDIIATTVLGIAAFSLGYTASAYAYRAIDAGAHMAADAETT